MSYSLSKDKLKNIKSILIDDVPDYMSDMLSFIADHTKENITPLELTRVFTMISCDLASLQTGGKCYFENMPNSLVDKLPYVCALELRLLVEKIAPPEFTSEFNQFHDRIVLGPLRKTY